MHNVCQLAESEAWAFTGELQCWCTWNKTIMYTWVKSSAILQWGTITAGCSFI